MDHSNYGALRAFLIVNSLNKTASGLFAPLMSVFVVDLGGDLRHAGELASMYLLAATVFGMWVSRLDAKWQRLCLLASLALYVPLYLCFLLVESHDQLYLLQLALGLVGGMNKPATTFWMSRFIATRESAYLWQRDATARGLLGTIAAFVGGHLSYHGGYDPVFLSMAAISLVNLFLAVTWLDRRYFRVAMAPAGGAER